MSRAAVAVGVSMILCLAACAEPPDKEMDQAQGAIDSARAAGAEQYAATELQAAVDALRQSQQAVAQRDFRLALAQAIESRDQAHAASKAAASARARARGNVERSIAETSALLARLRDQLDQAGARVPRRMAEDARELAERVEKSLQEARAALEAEDYARSLKALEGRSARLSATMTAIADQLRPAARRGRR